MRRIIVGVKAIGNTIMMTPGIRNCLALYPDDELHWWYGLDGGYIPGTELMFGNPRILFRKFSYSQEMEDYRAVIHAHTTYLDKVYRVYEMYEYRWAENNRKQWIEYWSRAFDGDVSLPESEMGYDYHFLPGEVEEGARLVQEIGGGKPVVAVARHNATPDNLGPGRRLPNSIWYPVAEWLIRQGFVPVALGAASHGNGPEYGDWPGPRLYGYPLRTVAAFLKNCHATLATDTGLRHLAAAVGCNLYTCSRSQPLERIRCFPCRPGQRIFEDYILDGDRRPAMIGEDEEYSFTPGPPTVPMVISGAQKIL